MPCLQLSFSSFHLLFLVFSSPSFAISHTLFQPRLPLNPTLDLNPVLTSTFSFLYNITILKTTIAMARFHYMTGATLLAASFAAAASTANITQTDMSASNVPFGALINQCVVPGTAALTFDDGPFSYTSDLLEILSAYGAPATFFLNGNCLGDVYYNSDIVERIVNEGHQLGSHTCVLSTSHRGASLAISY